MSATMKSRIRFKMLLLSILLVAGAGAWAILPENLRNDDALRQALYRTEVFRGQQSHLLLPPAEARQNLQQIAASQPQNGEIYNTLSELDVQLLDFTAAEMHLRQFIGQSKDKDRAYQALEDYYHSRLQFDAEFNTILEHAKSIRASEDDVQQNTGPYLQYHRAIKQIQRYGLAGDPGPLYEAIVDAYPNQEQPYLEYIDAVKQTNPKQAQAMLERLKQKFPQDAATTLRAATDLLPAEQAFDLLNKNFQPLWNLELVRLLDTYAVNSGKKGEYLNSLKERIHKNPLDFDAMTRAFYSYHLAGNATEAQQILNDFRLQKEQSVRDKKSSWSAEELSTMAALSHLVLNFDDEARYDYSLYMMLRGSTSSAKVTPDLALRGLFGVLLAADQRPIQIGAGNIDYYKDIAAADTNPGVLNGILSLIFNSADPESEWKDLQPRVVGYYNRAQALRLLLITQRDYPKSSYLPSMYRDALGIYEKYGMNDLIIQAGEQFFKAYPGEPEILDVGIAVADAYSRTNDHEHEWKTYDFLLPIAASMKKGALIGGAARQETSEPSVSDDTEAEGDEYSDDESGDDDDTADTAEAPPPPPPTQAASTTSYESLLNRYISSLTQQKNYLAVVDLYKAQIGAHPGEEGLYENFASFLAANQLLEDESRLYQQAIQQFKEKSWYEKLARWYLRNQREKEFEDVSKQIIDTFSGTEVATYLQNTVPAYSNPYRALYLALNEYAHDRFPYHLGFVRNLMAFYATEPEDWDSWEALATRYYALDETIRSQYLARLSRKGELPESLTPSNTVEKRFAGDVQVWRSHFEEAVPYYRELSAQYQSDRQLNIELADLLRSLGAYDPRNYEASAALREHLALIQPSDSSLWTTAGETFADIEGYDRAKTYWQNILKIDPRNSDRYLEVATILWDYYLFDDALSVLEQSRKIEDNSQLFAYEAGAIQESRRRYDLAVAEYSKSLLQESDSARRRLIQLYERPKLTELVRATLEQRLKENPQEPDWWLGVIGFYSELKERDRARDLITRAITTMKPEHYTKAAPTLMTDARNLGFTDLEEQMLQLQVTRAGTELDRIQLTLDLARFYEAQEQQDRAETAYRKLYTSMPRSVGIINELLSYYWRAQRYDKAFAVYNEVIPVANAAYKKQFLLESARRHLARKDYAPALAAARELNAGDPMNSDYFQLIAEAYAGQQDFAALSGHYKQGLERIRTSNLPEDQKKTQIASMRRGIIAADLILKDYSSGLDQYIEILNRDAENTSLLTEVSDFALKHDVFERLTDYYTKTAAASPKDHRWPMMLGRLRFTAGQFEAAINNFQAAVAIRPERTDLRRQLAESFQRLGRNEEALAAYEKLYVMTYKDKSWLEPMAELQFRLGNRPKALELYTLSRPSDESAMTRDFALCGKALQWGLAAEAVKYGERAMKEYDEDMSQTLDSYGLQQYTEALVRSGASTKALEVLWQTYDRVKRGQADATFDTEELRSTEYTLKDAITRAFPEQIRTYLTGDQMQILDAALSQTPLSTNLEWKRDLLLPMVRAAGMAPAEERLLRELNAKDDSESHSFRNQLRDFYQERMAYRRCAEFLEEQWRLHPEKDWRDDLIEIARNYKLAGMQDKELVILREYYQFGKSFSIQPEPVERYLALLYERKAQEELIQAADMGNYTAANYFIRERDQALALRAANAIARAHPPVWAHIQHAMLARDFRSDIAGVQDDYRIALDLRPIGEQIAQSSENSNSVLGDNWFYYGTRYGEHLWWAGQKELAALYLASDLEGAPTSGERQESLGTFYMNEKDYPRALDHFTLAAQLDTKSPTYQDNIARALYSLGRKDEAFALWKQMISVPNSPRCELLVDSAVDFEFVDSIRKDVEDFLQKRIEQSGAGGLGTLAPLYLSAIPLDSAQALIAKWIPSADDPDAVAGLILYDDEIDPALRIQALRITSETLKQRMLAATGSERESLRSHYLSSALRFANTALANGNAAEALAASHEAGAYATSDFDTRDKLTLVQCHALIKTGKKSEALELLHRYVKNSKQETEPAEESTPAVQEDRYNAATQLLDAEELKAEANDFREEMYELQIASGAAGTAAFSGLARVKLEKNQLAAARDLLQRMIFTSYEYLDGFHTAAELMEEYKHLPEAIEYRQELAKRVRYDMKNLAMLSQDLMDSGKKADAAKLASQVLESNLAALEYRLTAAQVYARSATDLVGPEEMRDLEQSIRSSHAQSENAGSKPYSSNFRKIVLKRMLTPPLSMLMLQKFLDPQNKDLDVQLFEAFRASGEFENAFLTLDPDKAAMHQEYAGTQDGFDSGEDSYYDTPSYPVESLSLNEEKTRSLAMEMADCASKMSQGNARIFYLRMALHHTSDEAQKRALQEKLRSAQAELDEKVQTESRRYRITENIGRQS